MFLINAVIHHQLEGFVTEEDLHNVFDSFGNVLDVSIKESSVDKVGGPSLQLIGLLTPCW